MSKRTRGDGTRRDRVLLDVGGTRFTSSVSTLSANSTYFAALFSRWDDAAGEEHPEIFLDRDPDAFRVLLSCMRHKKPLLPEHDKDLFRRVLLEGTALAAPDADELARAFGRGGGRVAWREFLDTAWPLVARCQQ